MMILEYLKFTLGAWSDKDQYYKLGEKLELNENQVIIGYFQIVYLILN
ncbi:hypothetical protein [Clostridioides difficile]|nr:hypothetical protein [Clostridioides difficile]